MGSPADSQQKQAEWRNDAPADQGRRSEDGQDEADAKIRAMVATVIADFVRSGDTAADQYFGFHEPDQLRWITRRWGSWRRPGG
jgi:hypothetical protein